MTRSSRLRGAVPFVDPLSDDFQTLRGTMRGGTLVTGQIAGHDYNAVQNLKGKTR